MDVFDKCNFCKSVQSCENGCCVQHEFFSVDKRKMIETAKDYGISVTDVVTLINL